MVAGVERFKKFPDFVTVKVTPQPGIDRDHHIVCIVEVKRSNDTEAKAEEQIWNKQQSASARRKPSGISGHGRHGSHILVAG